MRWAVGEEYFNVFSLLNVVLLACLLLLLALRLARSAALFRHLLYVCSVLVGSTENPNGRIRFSKATKTHTHLKKG